MVFKPYHGQLKNAAEMRKKLLDIVNPHSWITDRYRAKRTIFGKTICRNLGKGIEDVRSLIQHGCYLDNIVFKEGKFSLAGSPAIRTRLTGLLAVIGTKYLPMVQLLVDNGVTIDPNPIYGVFRSPLQYAAEMESLEIVA